MIEKNTPYQEHNFHTKDNLLLYYREYGQEENERVPILCLSGVTRNSKDFHQLALHFSASRRVLCLDYRGRGCSAYDPNPRNYQPRVYVDDVMCLLSHANVHRTVVIGTSQGAIVAMLIANNQPSVLAGVVLNDMGPEIDERGLNRISEYVNSTSTHASWSTAIETTKSHYATAYPDVTTQDWKDMAERSFREMEDGRILPDFDPEIAQMIVSTGPPPKLWKFYRALSTIPTLAIRGELSDFLSQDTFLAMVKEKPDLANVTIPNRGHAPFLTEPESLQAIDDFLLTL